MKELILSIALLSATLVESSHASRIAIQVEEDDATLISHARSQGQQGVDALRTKLKQQHGVTEWDGGQEDIWSAGLSSVWRSRDGTFDKVVMGEVLPGVINGEYHHVYQGGIYKVPHLQDIYDPTKLSFVYWKPFMSVSPEETLVLYFGGFLGAQVKPDELLERLSQAKSIIPQEINNAPTTRPITTVSLNFAPVNVFKDDFDADDVAYKKKKLLASFEAAFTLHLDCESFLMEPLLRAASKFQNRLVYLSLGAFTDTPSQEQVASAPYDVLFKLLRDAPNLKGAFLGELPYHADAKKSAEWISTLYKACERPRFEVELDIFARTIDGYASWNQGWFSPQRQVFEAIVAMDGQQGIQIFRKKDLVYQNLNFKAPKEGDIQKKNKGIQAVYEELQAQDTEPKDLDYAKRKYFASGYLVISKSE